MKVGQRFLFGSLLEDRSAKKTPPESGRRNSEKERVVVPNSPGPPPPEGSFLFSRRHPAEEPLTPSHEAALLRVWEVYRKHFVSNRLKAAYYPYTNLTHTIRRRPPYLYVRISRFFRNEPGPVVEAVGHILFRKLLRMRPIRRMNRLCREAERRILARFPGGELPGKRYSKSLSRWRPPKGETHDLEKIYGEIVDRFFEGTFPEVLLFWSSAPVKSYWGKYYTADPPKIVLNLRLDNPEVPEYVVGAVLYHEMLHHHLGIDFVNGRRRIHTREFREAERRFPHYREAERFLKNFAGTGSSKTRVRSPLG